MYNAGNQDEERAVLGVAWSLPKERPELRVKIISAIPISRSRSLVRPVTNLGKTPVQVAVAWMLSHPDVTCALSAADTMAQFDDVRGASTALPAVTIASPYGYSADNRLDHDRPLTDGAER
jgi:aryl-alcohol dehydrogenase-like predicted oxidoreductase